jgi:hypothetical protein
VGVTPTAWNSSMGTRKGRDVHALSVQKALQLEAPPGWGLRI